MVARDPKPDESIEIINPALDEVENLSTTIEYYEEFIGESSVKAYQTGIYDSEFQALFTDQVLTIILKLLNRFEDIVKCEMRAFFNKPASQLRFPQAR